MIVDLLADGDVGFGVVPFDQLQRNQKLVVLYASARGLLHPDEPTPKLTAFVESAVATVYEHAIAQVHQEIDDPELAIETRHWRRLVLEAAREQIGQEELPDDRCTDKDTWTILLECLAGCVLWDNDYESQESLDLPPDKSRQLRAILGMDDDYYTEIPQDPTDDQAKLYVDSLVGLTADAR
jgi:hypothetical protein